MEIAGGDTIATTAAIIKKAHQSGASTISTAGIFSKGDQEIEVLDISEGNSDNPVVEALRKEGITSNHSIITTGKFIRDTEPITPYTLDELAKRITIEIIKKFQEKN